MVKILNISGGTLVCSLSSGETLRFNNREFTQVKEGEITPYLRNIEKKGYVKFIEVADKKDTSTSAKK